MRPRRHVDACVAQEPGGEGLLMVFIYVLIGSEIVLMSTSS